MCCDASAAERDSHLGGCRLWGCAINNYGPCCNHEGPGISSPMTPVSWALYCAVYMPYLFCGGYGLIRSNILNFRDREVASRKVS